jgi:hypothetical protein
MLKYKFIFFPVVFYERGVLSVLLVETPKVQVL